MILGGPFSWGQNPKKTAIQNETWNYVDLIKTLEKQLEKGIRSTSTYEILGDAYFAKGNYTKALEHYSHLDRQVNKMPKERLFRYIQSLKSGGAFAKAQEYQRLFVSKFPDDNRSLFFKNQRFPVLEWHIDSLSKVSFNSAFSDYGFTIVDNKGFFVSTRDTLGFGKRTHGWTGERFSNLYTVPLDSLSAGVKPKKFKKIRGRYNESMLVRSPIDGQLWFTRNMPSNSKTNRSKDGVLHTGIFILQTENGKDRIIPSPFYSKEYSFSHPTFDDKGCIYFAANLADSRGKTDLYQSCFEKGQWSTPKNLGDQINTEARENFPMYYDHRLYFASEGLPGLGGYDIWFVELLEDGNFGRPVPLPEPVNSPFDDFAFFEIAGQQAYFSSNRDTQSGDDIYYVSWHKKTPPCFVELTFRVMDVLTGELIDKEQLNWLWKWGAAEELQTSKSNSLKVDCQQLVDLEFQHPDYDAGQVSWTPNDPTELTLFLVKKPKSPEVGDDLAKLLAIEQIYFDLDRWNIRPDAAIELHKIREVLLQFPDIKIDIRSHTDSRASDTYNLNLSEKRAQSTMQWLIEHGISQERLTAKGYGETQLLNHCKNNVPCSEEEHQRNRRSEFIIVE